MQLMEDAEIVDTGKAEEYVVTGLGSVTAIDSGWAEFGFFRVVHEGGARIRLVKVKLIAPVTMLAPAFDLCVATLGAGVLMPPADRRRLLL